MSQTLDRPADAGLDPAQARVERWLAAFERGLAVGEVSSLFTTDCHWRDLVAFTWNLKTVEGRAGVADLVGARAADTAARGFRILEPVVEDGGLTTAWIGFDTAVGRGKGLVRLKEQDGAPRAWTLLTTLYELSGYEEPRGPRRQMGAEHGADPNRETWSDHRERETAELGYTSQPYVLVIGGGQGGIALGARLRQLDVPTIVIDKHPNPGDQWRSRYRSLCLHDPVWYDHLPYVAFPDHWPVFAPKDKVADWLESYVRIMELNYWSSTEAIKARFDARTGTWTVDLMRAGTPMTLRPTHVVLATGMSGRPNLPVLAGAEDFRGEQHHSSAHPGPDAYAGQRAVVIGSNNSAFDICGALWEKGAEVTMVQRSSTHIVKSASLMDLGLGDLYSERALAAGMTTEKADLTFASLPYRIMADFQIPVYDAIRARDHEFYARLESAGFDHDWGEDGSGLFMKYLRRGSGYYIDVGSAELVADGRVHLAHGQVDHLTADTVVLADGTELPADLVVYATGYGSMNGWAAELIDQATADKVGKVWGLGSDTRKDPGPWEGEQRNMWKPTQQENLWFHGGNLHQSRHYSLYLALQLKARAVGLSTPVYALQETHHLD